MNNPLVDEVKKELRGTECPQCKSKVLHGVWTRVVRIDFGADISEIESDTDTLLEVYCTCGFSSNGYER